VIRQFVGFDEAAAMLGTDYEGLRQGFELDLAWKLPAYVYAGAIPFLAYPQGKGVEVSTESIDEVASGTVTIPGFGELSYFDCWGNALGDERGEVTASELAQRDTGRPFSFELKGFFRVAPYQMKTAARENHVGMVEVSPDAWWEPTSPIPKLPNGAPAVRLVLAPINHSGYSDLPALSDLQFKVADVEAFKRASATVKDGAENRASLESDTTKPLDERERTSLLRIIRALEVMAKLPLRGSATPIATQLQHLGFAKPGEATIRKLIEQARTLEPDNPQ
jgi:hypothetical protein